MLLNAEQFMDTLGYINIPDVIGTLQSNKEYTGITLHDETIEIYDVEPLLVSYNHHLDMITIREAYLIEN